MSYDNGFMRYDKKKKCMIIRWKGKDVVIK